MLRTWRIIKAKYAATAFSGEGARLFGGRWTSPGTTVVYVAQSLSLATLEILVHLQQPMVLADYVVFSAVIPEECVQVLPEKDWPKNWRDYPTLPENQAIGDKWVHEARSLVLQVPSAITVKEYNYLINPQHSDFPRLLIEGPTPLDVDERIFRK